VPDGGPVEDLLATAARNCEADLVVSALMATRTCVRSCSVVVLNPSFGMPTEPVLLMH
jgi:hypothetical protein